MTLRTSGRGFDSLTGYHVCPCGRLEKASACKADVLSSILSKDSKSDRHKMVACRRGRDGTPDPVFEAGSRGKQSARESAVLLHHFYKGVLLGRTWPPKPRRSVRFT